MKYFSGGVYCVGLLSAMCSESHSLQFDAKVLLSDNVIQSNNYHIKYGHL